MEFDKSRVYSSVNADELKIGSKCIFANTIEALKSKLLNVERYIDTLDHVCNEDEVKRFQSDDTTYLLAYLIEPPIEPNYCSFCNTETAFKIITAHGCWVKNKQGQHYFITAIDIGGEDECGIMIGYDWISSERFVRNYVFADDNTPCGELVE